MRDPRPRGPLALRPLSRLRHRRRRGARALGAARLVVWQHPLYWYGVPALLKHWFDKVLAYGWAYGEGGTRAARQALPVGDDDRRGDDGLPDGGRPRPSVRGLRAGDRADRALLRHALAADRIVVHGAHRIAPRRCAPRHAQYRARLEAVTRGAPLAERLDPARRADLPGGGGGLRAAREARSAWARCSATWSPAARSARGASARRRRRVDPALRRVRRGADAVRHRPRARAEAARGHAARGVRRRRAAAGRVRRALARRPLGPRAAVAGALVAGLALALSSTAIAMQTMASATCSPRRSAARRSPCCCSRTSRRSR